MTWGRRPTEATRVRGDLMEGALRTRITNGLRYPIRFSSQESFAEDAGLTEMPSRRKRSSALPREAAGFAWTGVPPCVGDKMRHRVEIFVAGNLGDFGASNSPVASWALPPGARFWGRAETSAPAPAAAARARADRHGAGGRAERDHAGHRRMGTGAGEHVSTAIRAGRALRMPAPFE
jgi:hypothetical protein